MDSTVKGENLNADLVVNESTVLNFAKDKYGNRYGLKSLSKKSLEDFAEKYKQAIIKKHSK